jgi:uncharacterized membrane protein
MDFANIELPVIFSDPWWLLAFALLPPLIVLGLWQGQSQARRSARGGGDAWRPRASTAIRALILSLLLLALAGMEVVRSAGPLTVIYLVDVSDSVSTAQQEAALAYVRGGLAAKGADDKAGVVLFGARPGIAQAISAAADLPELHHLLPTSATDIAGAIRLGLALVPDAGARRFVLISDGLETVAGAHAAAAQAGASGIPIDVVPYTRDAGNEVGVAGVGAPKSVPLGQQFDVTVVVQSTHDTTAHLVLTEDSTQLDERDVPLVKGNNTFTFPANPTTKGFHTYRARVSAVDDHFAENDTAAGYAVVTNAPKVLIVAGDPADGDPLQTALGAAHVDASVVAPADMPATLQDLSAYDAVVLANAGADSISPDTQTALQAYVRDLGRGLVMVGGENSFGAGGYLRSPLEEALPVTMDVKSSNREADVALALVVDKSGSMGRCHCGNSGAFRSTNVQQTGIPKTDIAKEAIVKAAATLNGADRIGVVAFDTQAQWVVNLQPVRNVPDLADLVAGIKADGNTNIFSGLRAATDALEQSDAKIKHIILLSDGWSDQGQYDAIVSEMRANNITLSAIAAGAGTSEVLENLAHKGGGRYYGALDMNSVPQIFLKETSLAAGTYLTEAPFVPDRARASPILKGLDNAALPQLLGYNNSTAKGTAEVILTAPGGDPVLAQWQYGLGRAVAWTSDIKGRWARDWVTWPQFSTFAAQMIGWTLPREVAPGITTNISTVGSESTIQVDSTDPSGAARNDLPTSAQVTGPDGSTTDAPLAQAAPGRYEGTVRTADPGVYQVQVTQVATDGSTLAQQTLGLIVPYSAEYRLDDPGDTGQRLLADLAAASGGRVLAADAPAAAFAGGLASRPQRTPLWPLLLTVALLLFPLDVAVRRLTMTWGDVGRGLRAIRGGLRRGPTGPPAPSGG